ncbi:CoA transferase, partial [archaeon]
MTTRLRESSNSSMPHDRFAPDTSLAWMTMYAAQYLASGKMPGKNGSGQAGIVPYRAYRTADGDLVVAAGNDGLFRKLCAVLGHAEWAGDPRFVNNPAR